jgi:hypothetical protein
MMLASESDPNDVTGSARIFFHLQALRSIVDQKNLKGGIVIEGECDLHYLLKNLAIENEDFVSFSYSILPDQNPIPIGHLGSVGIMSTRSASPDLFSGYWISRTRAQEILFLYDRPFYSIPGKMTIDRLFRRADREIRFTFPQLVFIRPLSKDHSSKDHSSHLETNGEHNEDIDLIYRLPQLDREIATWMGYSIESKEEYVFLQTLLAFRRVINDHSDCAIIISPKTRLVEGFSDKFDFLSDEIEQDLLILSPIDGLEPLGLSLKEPISETEDGNAIYEVQNDLTNHQLGSIGGYWISREWIERLLHLFDRPRRYLPPIDDFNLLSILTSSGAVLGTIRDPLVFPE